MDAIDGTGRIADEPVWGLLLTDPLEVEAARRHWARITGEMRERDTLAASNGHMIQRLVIAYLVYDRAAREVAEKGAVAKPKRGNPKAIARVSPYYTAMRDAAGDAAGLEAELGLSPRRRAAAAKIDRKNRSRSAAAAYLKSVEK